MTVVSIAEISLNGIEMLTGQMLDNRITIAEDRDVMILTGMKTKFPVMIKEETMKYNQMKGEMTEEKYFSETIILLGKMNAGK